ncbi:MAG TPA: hypothetical protein VGH91_07405 [Gammaproteobacteria bacterium]|jgi:hypothetical protein
MKSAVPDDSRLAVLASPAFILALLALLANDFLLKSMLHDWLTGKLSDFAGLFVFASLWLVLLPGRPRAVLLAAAAFFAWWKSPLSHPCIDFWNQHLPLHLHRVVDYSDLLALAVLPLAQLNLLRWRGRLPSRFVIYPVGLAAMLAVTGTSMISYTSGTAHVDDTHAKDNAAIAQLYADIDEIVVGQGFVALPHETAGWHRSYRNGADARILEINYDTQTGTLFYFYSPAFKDADRQNPAGTENTFLHALSEQDPDLKIETGEESHAGSSMVWGSYNQDITFPSHGSFFNTCDDSGANNPDLRAAYQLVDDLARENGLVADPPNHYDRTVGLGYCIKGDLYYRGGHVTGASARSFSLTLSEHMQFEIFGTGTTAMVKIESCCEARDRIPASALATALHDRLQALHWQDPDVTLDPLVIYPWSAR